jgi:hypothetical protein
MAYAQWGFAACLKSRIGLNSLMTIPFHGLTPTVISAWKQW